MKVNRLSGTLADVTIAWLPCLVLFILVPFAVYLPNQDEYDYNIVVMAPFLVLAGISFILILAFCFVGKNRRTGICLALFYLGVFFLLSDILAPVQWGPLDGESKITEPFYLTVIELLLAAVVTFCAVKLPMNITRRFGVILVIVLFVLAAHDIFRNLSKKTVWSVSNETGSRSGEIIPIEPSAGNRSNVYQVVFDGYSSFAFWDAVRELGLSEHFEGFTFFEKNLSNYVSTDQSVPSFLTGRLYETGSFKQWQHQAKKGGLVGKLHDVGYTIWIYSPNRSRFWTHDKASYVRTNRDLVNSYFPGYEMLNFAHIWLVRVAPNFLQDEAYRTGGKILDGLLRAFSTMATDKGLNRRLLREYSFYKCLSVPLMRELMRDEARRRDYGEYVYCHVMLPHSPYNWDRDCSYCKQTSYSDQVLCATKLMVEFVEELKKLDRYESSLIIFQSDHGFHGFGPTDLREHEVPSEVTEAITSFSKFSVDGYLNRLHALLVVKPPFAPGKRLIRSEAPTQLADIPATVYDVLRIPVDTTDGRSVLAVESSEPREIHMYVGMYSNNKNSKGLILGKDIFRTKLGHLSFTNGTGWHLYPDLPVTYE